MGILFWEIIVSRQLGVCSAVTLGELLEDSKLVGFICVELQ